MRAKARAATTRAKERANISFFIFVMFFAVFGVIVLTELLLLERTPAPAPRARLLDDLQGWPDGSDGRTDGAGDAESAPPPRTPLDAGWQPVAGTRFNFYVYSAFVERRTIAAVRVVGATKTRGADSVYCRLWLPKNRTVTVRARVKAIRENWNLRYSACFVLCPLRDTGAVPDDLVGATVAIVASPHAAPTNLLRVQETKPQKGIQDTVHVCVKPFHFSYSRDEWLVEWMELNLLLGVSHIYMYNQSLSTSVACVLEHYRQQGLVTLLPWKLKLVSKIEIRTEGQFAAFNDCLYRSMSSAGWLIAIDVDEVIMPRRERTLPALLGALRAAHPTRPPSALLFRNAFFYQRWEDDKTAPAPLITARKTRRWAVPHAVKNRSKYAVRPTDVVELGNHFVWEFAPGCIAAGVPPERGLLHHYREACEFGGSECLAVPSTRDRTAHRWSVELNQRVTIVRGQIHAVCAS